MPTPGDVDVVIAAELMEAGRSVLRGLVTPDRTTLIASTHRAYAVVEKETPGDGVARSGSGRSTRADVRRASASSPSTWRRWRTANGSVISACMFGALAGSGALPFRRAKPSRRRSRPAARASSPSLSAFGAAHTQAAKTPSAARATVAVATRPAKRFAALPTSTGHPRARRSPRRASASFRRPLHAMLFAGVKRLVDFQDVAYANEYLDRLTKLCRARPRQRRRRPRTTR